MTGRARVRYVLVAALISALSLLPDAVLADSGLKRLTLRQDALGWEAVGRLDLDDRGFCTGVLIETDLVLTAAHCLVDARSGTRTDPARITFHAGLRDGAAIAVRTGSQAVLHPNYDPHDTDGWRQLTSDVALLKLDAPIPAAHAAPFRTSSRARAGTTVSLVSYARGRDRALSWQKACETTGQGRGVLMFSCDADFGSSGAPVFELSSGRPRIVSLVSRGAREPGRIEVYGMEIEAPVAALRKALRTGEGVWPDSATSVKHATSRPQPLSQRREIGARFLRP